MVIFMFSIRDKIDHRHDQIDDRAGSQLNIYHRDFIFRFRLLKFSVLSVTAIVLNSSLAVLVTSVCIYKVLVLARAKYLVVCQTLCDLYIKVSKQVKHYKVHMKQPRLCWNVRYTKQMSLADR